jgi:hypothetical protein
LSGIREPQVTQLSINLALNSGTNLPFSHFKTVNPVVINVEDVVSRVKQILMKLKC